VPDQTFAIYVHRVLFGFEVRPHTHTFV